MNQASHPTRSFLATFAVFAVTLRTPSRWYAAHQASLPWDYALDTIQNFVTDRSLRRSSSFPVLAPSSASPWPVTVNSCAGWRGRPSVPQSP